MGRPFLLQLLDQRLPAALGKKETWLHLLQAHLGRKAVGARANQHHIRRLLHHRARQADGVARAGDAGHRSCLQGCAIHDRRVQLVLALGGEDRAAPCVEEWIVFENPNRGFDGVER
jgi:hypothetical protein